MEFNRKGPEGGVEIYSTIRNNRAFLECKIHLQKTRAEELLEEVEDITGVGYPPGEQCIQEAGDVAGTEGTVLRVKKGYLDIRVWDREERLVLQCRHSLEQEELAEGILLQPNLWQGVPDPYLYRIRIALIEKGNSVTDVLEDYFALRDLHEVSGKGWMLNGAPFPLRPVAYAIPTPLTCGEEIQTRMHEDLKLIRDMGANVVCPIESKITREFCRVCDELGLVVWWTDARKAKSGKQEEIPRFHGGFGELFSIQKHFPTARYYYYKARWSLEPFVYIDIDSLRFQKNGNAEVKVYSNQKKVALYTDGVLFEFQSEGPEFSFSEIPAKRLPLRLSAEAGECSMSATAFPVHTFFTQ